MFSAGDCIRVLVDDANCAEVKKGDKFVVKEVNPEGEEGFIKVEGPDYWWFSFKNIELVGRA